MSIRDSIAKMKQGEAVGMNESTTVAYVEKIARENGLKLRCRKEETGGWNLTCLGRKQYNARYLRAN